MANHDHPIHVPCLFSMLMSGRSRLSLSNQSLFSFPDPFLIWVVDQINQRHSPDLTDSSPLQYLYSFVMSIQSNCVFLPRRRFVSGAFPCRRWFFRLSTGDCPLTHGYGGFTWVFDPGINRVLAEDENIIKLVETKKNSHVQWINFGDLVPLFGHSIPEFPVHRYPRSMLKELRLATKRGLTAHPMIPEKYMDQRKASYSQCFVHGYMRRRPYMMILHQPYDASEDEFGFLLKIDEASTSPRWSLDFWDWILVYLCSQVDSMNGMSDFKKRKHLPWQQIWVLRQRRLMANHDHLFVVITNKKSFSEASDFSMRCALWSFNKEMFLTHTFRISERSKMEKEIAIYSGSTETRIMDFNQHQWVERYRRHGPEPFQATYQSIRSIKVMRKAFRSFIYMMIACYECMKRGLNRFILLPVRLLLESRVTSTSSSKLGFNFLYLVQWLYLNGFMYHVKLL